jgi:hypothetical protein
VPVSVPLTTIPRSRQTCEPDFSLGQGPRLVGKEHHDIAEILDADETLHEHRALGHAAGPGGEADRDDCRQQLWSQAYGDCQREQEGFEQ